MITYEKVTDIISGNITIIRTNEDGVKSFIPSDPANSDYQTYLKSLEDEANTL